MAIKIVDVNIHTEYNWQSVKNLGDWSAVKNTNSNWQQPLQSAVIGQQLFIEVEIIENNWLEIRKASENWQEIKTNFTSWLGLKNW